MQGEIVNIFFDKINRKKMTAHIEMHSTVGETGMHLRLLHNGIVNL